MNHVADHSHPRYGSDRSAGGTNVWLHNQVTRHAGTRPLSVLDLGCASGYLGAPLIAAGHRVDGVELDASSVEGARRVGYGHVAVGDIADHLSAFGSYDVLIAADVLEHVLDPAQILKELHEHTTEDSLLLVSVPNVANLSVRLQLLLGRWDYQETGILDRTHLWFFTFSSAQRLLTDTGWEVVQVDAASRRFGPILRRFGSVGRRLRGLLGYQVLLAARPAQRRSLHRP